MEHARVVKALRLCCGMLIMREIETVESCLQVSQLGHELAAARAEGPAAAAAEAASERAALRHRAGELDEVTTWSQAQSCSSPRC